MLYYEFTNKKQDKNAKLKMFVDTTLRNVTDAINPKRKEVFIQYLSLYEAVYLAFPYQSSKPYWKIGLIFSILRHEKTEALKV